MVNYFKDIQKGVTFKGRSIKFSKNGVPMDLTGVVATMEFRLRPMDLPTFSFKTSDATLLLPIPTNGELIMLKRNMNYPVSEYNFTLEITFPNGDVIKPIVSQWKIY